MTAPPPQDRPPPDPTWRGLDWSGLMRAGLVVLRLHPRDFWALTPAELALMLGLGAGPAPLTRARLAELSRAWPDGPGIAPKAAAAFAPQSQSENKNGRE